MESLRGDEGFIVDAAGLLHHIRKGREEALVNVVT